MDHTVREKSVTVEASESWSGELMGYDFHIHRDRHNTQLSVTHFKRGDKDGLRLGLIQFYPRSVGVIEKLAEDARELLLGIAAQMRAVGLDDLRGDLEKTLDENQDRLEAMLGAKP